MILEALLDGLLLALCGLSLLGRSRKALDALLPLAYTGLCLLSRQVSTDPMDYLVMPTDNPFYLLFLLIAVLMLNSLWYPVQEGHILWGTAAQLAVYLLLRWTCAAGLGLALGSGLWVVYGLRVLAVLLWLALQWTGLLGWLRARLADGDAIVRAASGTTLILLILLWVLQLRRPLRDVPWLPVTAALLSGLVLADGLFLLWERRRVEDRRRVRLMEQYLPMVEELVESVRARQHAFNNRMMAVSAAVNTADSLEEARTAVAGLLEQAGMEADGRALLKCDSKVMSGLLFGKMKQGELRHIRLEASICGNFLHRSLPEAGWVELAGILLDNALEASQPGDVVSFRVEEEGGALRLTVSNPCLPLSSAELTRMFRRGWSTKADSGRGYGLFNARELVERRGGKLIVRNEEAGGRNYLTIGAVIS